MIARQILFLFSALGAVNGLFLALYFLTRRPRALTDCLLGALLLTVGIRTAKSTFLYFDSSIALGFRQLGLSACLLIGPLTWLYVRAWLDQRARRPQRRVWAGHLGLAFAIIGIGAAFPYSAYRHVWDYSGYGIHVYWLCYLLAAGWALWRERSLLPGPGRKAATGDVLVVSVFLGSCIILAAYASTPFTSYIVGALSLTFSIHITVLVLLLRRDEGQEKYRNSKLAPEDAPAMAASLIRLMDSQKLHLNPNLTVSQLAKRAGYPQAVVSQILNETLGKSFNAFVNEYRIAEAMHLLASEPETKVDAIAERCGFNSASTFFTAFKKVTGQTPASYRAALTVPPAPLPA